MIGVNINLQWTAKASGASSNTSQSAMLCALPGVPLLPLSRPSRLKSAGYGVIALAPSSSLALIFTMKLKGDVIMAGNICSLSILLSTIAMTILLVYL